MDLDLGGGSSSDSVRRESNGYDKRFCAMIIVSLYLRESESRDDIYVCMHVI